MEFEYTGILVRQNAHGPELLLFSAPATEIATWAGIPQRRRLDGGIETAGFQREEAEKRVAAIARFMHNPANVIQNPLLAATQDSEYVEVKPSREDSKVCKVAIRVPDFQNMSLLDLFEMTIQDLETRLPALKNREVSEDIVHVVRNGLSIDAPSDTTGAGVTNEPLAPDFRVVSEDPEEQFADASGPELGALVFEEESRLLEFYDELQGRAQVLRELGTFDEDSLVGFSREFLESLLLPIVLVDGQHRLKGANRDFRDFEKTPEAEKILADLIDGGCTPQEAREELQTLHGRQLPVSLLMTDDRAEHVFQFVVVNQTATVMSNALLGTIVSTSLTQDEVDPIRTRLHEAGIQFESSRATSFMSRSAESPFFGLVRTGVGGDPHDALSWEVLGKLIAMVRDLHGAKQEHAPHIDFAREWRSRGFQETTLDGIGGSESERLDAWRDFQGPWRTMFIKLHSRIRDQFGSTEDPNAWNYWGAASKNLYNKVSLSILTVDWFSYLQDRSFSEWAEVDVALDEWIGGLNASYFNRDFKMSMKKDQPLVRRTWSELWAEFRLTKKMPSVGRYNPSGRR